MLLVTRPFRLHPSDRPGTQGDALGLRITAPWAVLTPTFARINALDYRGQLSVSATLTIGTSFAGRPGRRSEIPEPSPTGWVVDPSPRSAPERGRDQPTGVEPGALATVRQAFSLAAAPPPTGGSILRIGTAVHSPGTARRSTVTSLHCPGASLRRAGTRLLRSWTPSPGIGDLSPLPQDITQHLRQMPQNAGSLPQHIGLAEYVPTQCRISPVLCDVIPAHCGVILEHRRN